MEKEQKKLLLVAVSVGVFLLVTITVAFILLSPKNQSNDKPFYSSLFSRPQTLETESVITTPQQPVINNTQETNIIIDGNPETQITIDKVSEDSLIIQIPKPSAAAVPSVSQNPVSDTREQRVSETRTTKPAAQAQAPVKPATTIRAAAPVKTVSDYWIQIGAFSAKIRAEDAKELLNSKGLTSIIDNREIDGRNWYRVRLGPYTSENEANYWLALVKTIDGFEESQMRQSVRQL